MHMDGRRKRGRKHAKEKSEHAHRRTREEDRPRGRQASTGGNLFSPEFKLHFRAQSIFLSLSLSLSLTPKSWKTRRCQSLRTSNEEERARKGGEERTEERAFYHVDAREIKPSRNGGGRASGEITEKREKEGGVKVDRPPYVRPTVLR